MASTNFGHNLNPYRKLRDPLEIKGARHSVVITNNPSSIDQNQQLLVRFPNLGSYDVIVPGTAHLAFTISLTSTDDNRTVVQNLGRAVVKKTTIKISGNEVLSIDYSDVFHCYLANASEGVTIQITKTAETAGALNIYLYVLMDAQLNIKNSRFISALY